MMKTLVKKTLYSKYLVIRNFNTKKVCQFILKSILPVPIDSVAKFKNINKNNTIQAFANELYHFIIISFGTSAGFSVLFLQEMLQKSLKMS